MSDRPGPAHATISVLTTESIDPLLDALTEEQLDELAMRISTRRFARVETRLLAALRAESALLHSDGLTEHAAPVTLITFSTHDNDYAPCAGTSTPAPSTSRGRQRRSTSAAPMSRAHCATTPASPVPSRDRAWWWTSGAASSPSGVHGSPGEPRLCPRTARRRAAPPRPFLFCFPTSARTSR